MTSPATLLREFQAAFGEENPGKPTPCDKAGIALRRKLISEEAREVDEALGYLAATKSVIDAGYIPDPDAAIAEELAAVGSELADLVYVAYGTADKLGIDLDAVLALVHAANMKKLGGPRRADGKFLKPEGWQPADILGEITRQMSQ